MTGSTVAAQVHDKTSSFITPRKRKLRDLADRLAPERDAWISQNATFYKDDRKYMKFLIPEDQRVLEVGCGTGELLEALAPSAGVGVDFSEEMIAIARQRRPQFDYVCGDIEDPETFTRIDGTFDTIIISDTIGYFDDIERVLAQLHPLCHRDTRIVIAYYGRWWEPIIKLASTIYPRMPTKPQNWLSTEDISGLLHLADFEVIKCEWRQLMPIGLLGLQEVINKTIGTLPIIRRFCLRNYVVARPLRDVALGPRSATVMVPCRNERGNIEAAITRTPRFCDDLEFLFVEGHSQDGTWDEIQRVIAAYPDVCIRAIKQPGKGKGDAVRAGFEAATGEILIILDADLTTPPEDMPKFYNALVSGKGNFINGSRLVYPMEDEAMQTLNFFANGAFAVIFSWLLNQRITDTLCGTKVLLKHHYDAIAAGRSYFGDFDPFGDFDLIFGAAKLNLKIIDIPVRYAARSYGETQISRMRHGWMLLKMVAFAFRKLKTL
jgi:SAM-dependent methyltransferase